MKVLKFWLEKFKFMIIFAWWREWMLVSEEWKMTYAELCDAQSRSYEIYRDSVLRLLKGIEGSTEEEKEILARLREKVEED